MILFCMHFQNTSFGSNYMLLQPILRLLQSFRLSLLPYLIRLTPSICLPCLKNIQKLCWMHFLWSQEEGYSDSSQVIWQYSKQYLHFSFIGYKLQITTITFEKNYSNQRNLITLTIPLLLSALQSQYVSSRPHYINFGSSCGFNKFRSNLICTMSKGYRNKLSNQNMNAVKSCVIRASNKNPLS